MFSDDYGHLTPDEMRATLAANVRSANIPCMVVTMGEQAPSTPAPTVRAAWCPPRRSMSSTPPARGMLSSPGRSSA